MGVFSTHFVPLISILALYINNFLPRISSFNIIYNLKAVVTRQGVGISLLSKILAVNKLPWLIDLLGNESDKSFSLEVLLTLGILEEHSHEKVLL